VQCVQKYFNFRLCTSVRNLLGCSSSKIEAFVLCSLNILLCAVVSNAVILRLSAALSVHVSQVHNHYNPTGQTRVHIILSFICWLSARSFQIHSSELITALAIANLVMISLLQFPSSVIIVTMISESEISPRVKMKVDFYGQLRFFMPHLHLTSLMRMIQSEFQRGNYYE